MAHLKASGFDELQKPTHKLPMPVFLSLTWGRIAWKQLVSCSQTHFFTNGAQVFEHQPLFNAISMEVVATFQCPKIFSIIIFFLHVCKQLLKWFTESVKKPQMRKFITRQTQQGSASNWAPGALECFRRFIQFNIVSSLNPVLTLPMRSSRANSSYYPQNNSTVRIFKHKG